MPGGKIGLPHPDKRLMLARRRKGLFPKPSINSLDKRIKKINSETELKWNDSFGTITSSDTAATVAANAVLLNAMAQGTTAITRLGDLITMTSLQIRFLISSDIDRITTTQVRILIFFDRQANAAAPVIGSNNDTALLDNSVVTLLYNSPFNHRCSERYRVIYDKRVDMNPLCVFDFDVATGTTSQVVQLGDSYKFKKSLSTKVKFNGAGGAIGDVITNSLHIAVITAQATELPLVQFGARIYYKDS